MEDFNLLLQILILLIAIPCLILFYWFIAFRILAFIIRTVKHIWNSLDWWYIFHYPAHWQQSVFVLVEIALYPFLMHGIYARHQRLAILLLLQKLFCNYNNNFWNYRISVPVIEEFQNSPKAIYPFIVEMG